MGATSRAQALSWQRQCRR